MSLTKKTMHRLALAIGLAAVLTAQTSPASEWWRHVVHLSDDSYRGRETGTPEHRKAAEYVAAEFKRAGLSPALAGGYLQPVPLRTVNLEAAAIELTPKQGGTPHALTRGKDVVLVARGQCQSGDAAMAFVGYGLSIPERGHDDLANVDLTGKVAVFFAGAPHGLSGSVVSHRQSIPERWRVLRQRGAVGAISIENPRQPTAPWDLIVGALSGPAYALAANDEFGERRFGALLNPAAASAFFAGSPQAAESILDEVKAGKPLPSFPLEPRLQWRLRCSEKPLTSDNVIGVLPGNDPALRNQFIVVTAHLDHIGQFGSGGDTIYNGAMDNASGVAGLIDAARRLQRAGTRLRRSLAFAAVTAEERGLLGSQYLVDSRPFRKDARVVANVNLDMFLPVIEMKTLVGIGMEESSLEEDVTAVAVARGLQAERDPRPAMNRFIRSDQYNFARAGIPAVFLGVGAGADDNLQKQWDSWMTSRYHRPDDDAAQPVNLEAAEKFQQAVVGLLERLANASEAPSWRETSAFRRK